MESAVPTNNPVLVYKKLQPEAVTGSSDKRDIDLYEMALTDGWKQIKENIEGDIKFLDNNMNIEATDTAETIGLKYIAASLTKAYLKKILETVSSSYDVIRERAENNNTN